MPEALQDYCDALQPDSITDTEDDYEGNNINKKIMQLTGKRRAEFLMNALIEHNREIKELRMTFENDEEYALKRKLIRRELTNKNSQFKKQRIDKNLNM